MVPVPYDVGRCEEIGYGTTRRIIMSHTHYHYILYTHYGTSTCTSLDVLYILLGCTVGE